MKKNSGLVLIISQEQCGKELSTGKQDRNKQQDDWDHSGVNQSKTIIKPVMLIQLKVTQNEKKNKIKLNNLTGLSHSVKKRKEKKKHNQTLLTQTYHVLTQDICF